MNPADKTLWKLVPVEPTPEMMDALRKSRVGENCMGGSAVVIDTRENYRVMLAAAPSPPAALDEEACKAGPHADTAEKLLMVAGVFKGAHGLRGLAQAQAFWENQPYGTRLYYGDGGADYLHRSILETAVKLLDAAALQSTAPAQESEAVALLRRITQVFDPSPSLMKEARAFLARHDQERK